MSYSNIDRKKMGRKIMKKLNSFQWASCTNAKTLSFRAAAGDEIFKTVNSVFFDAETMDQQSTNEQCYSVEEDHQLDAAVEMVVKGVMKSPSERLFFEPGGRSCSIMEEEAGWLKESVAVAVETEDPYGDFRRSMEEMVVSHGVKEWEGLEELLGWYLRVNGKSNHGFIVGAFVDLLLAMAMADDQESESEICSSHESTSCYSSAASSFSSSPLGSSNDAVSDEAKP